MSRLEGRVERLIKTTHIYTSHEELCVYRDYIAAQLDELPKPADLEKQLKHLRELDRRWLWGENTESETRAIIADKAVQLAYFLPLLSERCDFFPHGVWEPIYQAHTMPDVILAGRRYLTTMRAKRATAASEGDQAGDHAPSRDRTT